MMKGSYGSYSIRIMNLKYSGRWFVCSEEVNTNIIGKGQKVKKFNKVKVSSCHWDF